MNDNQIYKKLSNSIKCLTLDAIEEAKSGHPGLPLGMADVMAVLIRDFLNFNVDDPLWMNRDRFVLSAGHGSMLLYSIIFLLGYKDISLDDIKKFRQLGSKATGHPEYGVLDAIETTTGPLGQGFANAVGMSLASKLLAKEFNSKLSNNKIYVLVGDGCLMEGISHEAASFAGHFNLNNLIVLFDDNKVSIDGPINLTCSDDNIKRFTSYEWSCFKADGHNYKEIYDVLKEAQTSDKPCFISFETQIGHGARNAGCHTLHGLPLGKTEISYIKQIFNYDDIPFKIEDEVLILWKKIAENKKKLYYEWKEFYLTFNNLQKEELERRLANKLPKNYSEIIYDCYSEIVALNIEQEATRKSSGRVLKFLSKNLPELIGGAADLTESTNTKINAENSKHIYYGIREHGMAGIMNGLALYKGFIPFGATFFVFSDYMRPAIRLAAQMKQKVIYIMTHDSIGLGEDGPTHQPIEHLASFRAMPGLMTFRPSDAIETLECWEIALKTEGPSIIALTRQDVKQNRREILENKSNKGAYILQEDDDPQIIIIATGSEVEIAIEVKIILNKSFLNVRIVSMPCWNLFDMQNDEYKREVLGSNDIMKVAIEAACGFGWEKYISSQGIFFGINEFGTSGNKNDLYRHFDLISSKIAEKILLKFYKVENDKNSY